MPTVALEPSGPETVRSRIETPLAVTETIEPVEPEIVVVPSPAPWTVTSFERTAFSA